MASVCARACVRACVGSSSMWVCRTTGSRLEGRARASRKSPMVWAMTCRDGRCREASSGLCAGGWTKCAPWSVGKSKFKCAGRVGAAGRAWVGEDGMGNGEWREQYVSWWAAAALRLPSNGRSGSGDLTK